MKHFRKTFLLLAVALVCLMESCSKEKGPTQKVQVTATAPCPPSINMDSLKVALLNQARQEVRRDLFMAAMPEDNPHLHGGIFKTNITFSEQTKIYAEPDTNSAVLLVLPFASHVNFLEGINRTNLKGILWKKITHPKDPNKNAYVRDKDMADYVQSAYETTSGFVIGEVDTTIEGYWDSHIELRRYKQGEHKILERYKTKYKASGYRFHKVYNSTLKAVGYADAERKGDLYVYETFRQSCPGGGMTEFILDNGHKLLTVATSYTEGEGGYYNHETVYIPLKFENEKILLVADADVPNIFNWQTAGLNVFPYSSKYKVPIENMVVVKYESNGYPDVNFDVDAETVKVKTEITIYEWDGKKLNKIQGK